MALEPGPLPPSISCISVWWKFHCTAMIQQIGLPFPQVKSYGISLEEASCQHFSLLLSTLERSDSRLVQRLGDPFLHPIHSVGGMISSHKAHLFLYFLFLHVSSSKMASTETCFHFLLPLATFSIWGSVGQLPVLSSGSIEISKTNFSKLLVSGWHPSLGSRPHADFPNSSMPLVQSIGRETCGG